MGYRTDRFIRRVDGSITIDTGGYRYHLPPITLGQYRTLRQEADYVTEPELIIGWVVRAVAMLGGWWITDPPLWFSNEELPVRMIDHWRAYPIPLFEKKPVSTDPRQRLRQKPPVALRATGVLAEIAPIYEALASRGITPPYEDLPLWTIAAMLGLHNPPEEEQNQIDWLNRRSLSRNDAMTPPGEAGPVGPIARKNPTPPPSTAPVDPSEVLRARIAAAEAGAPAPKWSEEEMMLGARSIANGLSMG